VDNWISEYVEGVYQTRGYNPESEAVERMITSLLPAWQKLLMKTGLVGKTEKLKEIAIDFSLTTIGKGIGAVLPAFADFINAGNKKGDLAPAASPALPDCTCEFCDGIGVVMVDQVHRSGELFKAAYRCDCPASVAYAGVPAASPESMASARRENLAVRDRQREWLKRNGIDPDRPLLSQEGAFTGWVRNIRFDLPPPRKTIKTEPSAASVSIDDEMAVMQW
jgi:hypothetical protein